MLKRLWNYIWNTGWDWTNRETGEKKPSPAYLKITCLMIIPLVIFMVLAAIFHW